MAILESLTIALGTGIAKYLVKEVLPAEWQDQISEELIDLGLSFVKGKRQEPNPVALVIGQQFPLWVRFAENPTDQREIFL